MKIKELKMSGQEINLRDIIIKFYGRCSFTCGPNPKNIIITSTVEENCYEPVCEVFLEREETTDEQVKRLYKEDENFRESVIKLIDKEKKMKNNFSLYKKVSRNDKRQKLWREQRNQRGFDDTEFWNLDVTIAKFIIPRLREFKKKTNGYPHNLTMKGWRAILQKMVNAFVLISNDKVCENRSAVIEGLDLFRLYFFDLWD